MSFFNFLLGNDNEKYLQEARSAVAKINELEEAIKALSDEDLKAKTPYFKKLLAEGQSLDDILPEAFAVVRETARRTLGQRHYDVQLIGGFTLHRGRIAEMRTGEGKTLVATAPLYLNALSGKGAHLVTVNDYLARRDAVWMGQIYNFLGLSVGVINNQSSFIYDPSSKTEEVEDKERDERGGFEVLHDFLRATSRQDAYAADITYGTNNEFGFDYLKDNLAYETSGVVQRFNTITGRYNYAIIDEVDSILIDEARTPLIISAPVAESENLYQTFARIATSLRKDVDYTVDEKLKAIQLTEAGIDQAEKLLGVGNIYTEGGIKYVHHLETAVRAQALFERDKDYVNKDGEIVIVDEFTGRLQPGRRWSEGLHQAIEAKEGVRVREESRTFATVTLQNYFRLYEKLSGMTGTASTSTEEFLKVYRLPVVQIPTNKETCRKDLPDFIFQTELGKYTALTKKVKELQAIGQPVLIGTVSIEKNELLSAYFTRAGVRHQILNAKNHEAEGQIIADAGKWGAVTIATNMAGRGVDIKLGGALPTKEEYEAVKNVGGLFVVGTERHEARRIDNQLRGRSGRQGDPGETQFFVSLEDTLMRVFASGTVKSLMGKLGIPADEPIEHRLVSRAIESAQEKIEGMNFDTRKHLLEYDDVVNHQRITIYNRRREILFGDREKVEAFLQQSFQAIHLETEEADKLLAKIEQRRQELGEDNFYLNARRAILQVVDMFWVEHLEAIEFMRSSVRLRAYGQRDPLVEFKKEGLRLFKDMELSIAGSVLELISNLGQTVKTEDGQKLEAVHEGASIIGDTEDRRGDSSLGSGEDKIGRNDPCPCGSGKKYKKCGLLNTTEHQSQLAKK